MFLVQKPLPRVLATFDAVWLLEDVQARIKNRIQLTTDDLGSYPPAVAQVFGIDVDYAQLVKVYRADAPATPERRYSPAICTGAMRNPVEGRPDEDHISTSYATEPEYAHGDEPLHSLDEHLLKEDRQSRSFARAIFSLLQLCAYP
jgi:hypothetical protein